MKGRGRGELAAAIVAACKAERRTVASLAAALGVKQETIRSTMGRLRAAKCVFDAGEAPRLSPNCSAPRYWSAPQHAEAPRPKTGAPTAPTVSAATVVASALLRRSPLEQVWR